MSGGEWTAMQKLVKQIYSRSDAGESDYIICQSPINQF